MKKIFKTIGIIFMIIFGSIVILVIPLLINILFKFDFNIWWLESEWTAGEALSFYGGLLSFVGTVILGVVSVWQTKKSNEISSKLLKKDLIDSTDFIQLENKFEATRTESDHAKITISSHHKSDYGANILIEPYDENVEKLNEYLIKLHFHNTSDKNHIKKIELENFSCVQDPDEGGLKWTDGSDDPIPLGLNVNLFKDVHLNWTDKNEFYIQFKVYCEPNQCFDIMMKNKVNLCFIFQLNIYNFYDVKTEMTYKLWISKTKKGKYEVMNTNSIINNNIIEEKK